MHGGLAPVPQLHVEQVNRAETGTGDGAGSRGWTASCYWGHEERGGGKKGEGGWEEGWVNDGVV